MSKSRHSKTKGYGESIGLNVYSRNMRRPSNYVPTENRELRRLREKKKS